MVPPRRRSAWLPVIPVGETIQVGETLQFAAGGRDINVWEVDLVNPFWSSSRPNRIEVDQRGLSHRKGVGRRRHHGAGRKDQWPRGGAGGALSGDSGWQKTCDSVMG